MKHLPISIFFLFLSFGSTAQIKLPPFAEKLKDKFFSSRIDSTRSPSFLPLPVLSYAQETGWKIGVLGLYSFYTDRRDSTIRNSSISAAMSYTTKKQTYLNLASDIWTPGNKYHYTSEVRYRNFPYEYYGIGSHTLVANKEILKEKRFRINGAIEKNMARHWYTGVRAGFDYFNYDNAVSTGIFAIDPPYGSDGGKILYVGLSQTYDSRNTNTYTTKGQLAKITLSYAPDFFGKDNYTGAFATLDYRYFHTLSPRLVLGANGKMLSFFSDKVPFYLLPQLGSDELMRGYYQGRYRDRNMMAAQSELRYRLTQRLGIVAFGGMGTVYGKEKLSINNVKPNYGGGLRYFFDLERNLSIRIDYGIGEQHSGEKRQAGWYFSLGEAF